MEQKQYDAIVVGAGFGGLGAALRLAELGVKTALVETLNYPGGCAATFSRNGYRFEAGATLSSGLSDDQLFGKWNKKYDLGIEHTPLDPVIDMRIGDHELILHADQDDFIDELCENEPKHAKAIRKFFTTQRKVADAFWPLFETPDALPPYGPKGFLPLLKNAPQLAAQLPLLNKSLADVVKSSGAQGSKGLRNFLDALCQITVQCDASKASAPIALSALAFPWRGSRHVHGGIGNLALGLAKGAEQNGVDIFYTERAKSLTRSNDGFELVTRKQTLRCQHIVLNLLPQAAKKLCSDSLAKEFAKSAPFDAADRSWGAVMNYAVVKPPLGAGKKAHHIQIVDDDTLPFNNGNHVFLSISAKSETMRAPEGLRTMTMSTHFDLEPHGVKHFDLSEDDQKMRVDEVRKRMLTTAKKRAGDWFEHVEFMMPGSPRTFERFTGRTEGRVGGPPRLAGAKALIDVPKYEVAKSLFLVGDTMSPGQSTYACAIGGVRVAESIASRA